MAGRIENWDELRALYVVHGKSHREIAKLAGCSNSSISSRAKRDDWEGQRLAYQSSVAQRGYEMAAITKANEGVQIVDESVVVARAYLRVFAQSIRDGTVKTNARDALEFMKFLVEQAGPKGDSQHSDPKVIDGSASPVEGREDLLRRLLDIARTRVAAPGGLGGAAVDDPKRTLPN